VLMTKQYLSTLSKATQVEVKRATPGPPHAKAGKPHFVTSKKKIQFIINTHSSNFQVIRLMQPSQMVSLYDVPLVSKPSIPRYRGEASISQLSVEESQSLSVLPVGEMCGQWSNQGFTVSASFLFIPGNRGDCPHSQDLSCPKA